MVLCEAGAVLRGGPVVGFGVPHAGAPVGGGGVAGGEWVLVGMERGNEDGGKGKEGHGGRDLRDGCGARARGPELAIRDVLAVGVAVDVPDYNTCEHWFVWGKGEAVGQGSGGRGRYSHDMNTSADAVVLGDDDLGVVGELGAPGGVGRAVVAAVDVVVVDPPVGFGVVRWSRHGGQDRVGSLAHVDVSAGTGGCGGCGCG